MSKPHDQTNKKASYAIENDAVISASSWDKDDAREDGVLSDKPYGLFEKDRNIKIAEHIVDPLWYKEVLIIKPVEMFNSNYKRPDKADFIAWKMKRR